MDIVLDCCIEKEPSSLIRANKDPITNGVSLTCSCERGVKKLVIDPGPPSRERRG